MRQMAFEALGTRWAISVEDDQLQSSVWQKLQADIHGRIAAFDATYSRFRDDSWVSHLGREQGTFTLPTDAAPLFAFYRRLYDATEGAVTPLIGQVLSDAGYDADYSFVAKSLRTPPSWEAVMTVGDKSVTMHQPALLDFGAAGKGYLVDIVSEMLEQAGVTSYLVDGSGDLHHRDARAKMVEVGLENPYDHTQVIGAIHLGNQSLCASAGSRRTWGPYHHIIDPVRLRSPEEITATWVVADDTMTADGLATALFFTPAPRLAQSFHFAYAILHQDMSLEYSPGLPITLYEA